MSDQLQYVYAVVPTGTDVSGAPPGIDGARVERVDDGGVAALVSRVAAEYGQDLGERLADVAWLGPRAAAHDAVLTWASDAGPVVPLPLFSLFRTADAVTRMLRDRASELSTLLETSSRGREYGVRLFRVDDELRDALPEFSPAVATLAREAAAATSPGQGYLVARKLDAARKEELRRVSADVATRALHRLAASSLASAQDPMPAPTGAHVGVAVLNASFLVAHERVDDFRAAVTELVSEYGGRGFRIEFTGPWPPYHFTRGEAAGSGNSGSVGP